MTSLAQFTVAGVVAILGLVALSAFFSSSETAIFTLPEEWASTAAAAADPPDRRLETLADLRSDPHRLLVTILVGNNVVNVAIASIATVLASSYLPAGGAVTVATVGASFLILIFGEIVPKSYGLGQAERLAPAVAGPLAVVERVLLPLVVGFDAVTRRLNARLGGDTDVERPYLDD